MITAFASAAIVDRVASGTTPPLRPALPQSETEEVDGAVKALMKQCWAEQANERPTFDEISKMLRSINKGRSVLIAAYYVCHTSLIA
jgi:hypothetical protein